MLWNTVYEGNYPFWGKPTGSLRKLPCAMKKCVTPAIKHCSVSCGLFGWCRVLAEFHWPWEARKSCSKCFHYSSHPHPHPQPFNFAPAPCYASMTLIQQRRYLATNNPTGEVTLSQLDFVENIREKTNSNAKPPKIKLAARTCINSASLVWTQPVCWSKFTWYTKQSHLVHDIVTSADCATGNSTNPPLPLSATAVFTNWSMHRDGTSQELDDFGGKETPNVTPQHPLTVDCLFIYTLLKDQTFYWNGACDFSHGIAENDVDFKAQVEFGPCGWHDLVHDQGFACQTCKAWWFRPFSQNILQYLWTRHSVWKTMYWKGKP